MFQGPVEAQPDHKQGSEGIPSVEGENSTDNQAMVQQIEELNRQVNLLTQGSARLEGERDSLLKEKVCVTTCHGTQLA